MIETPVEDIKIGARQFGNDVLCVATNASKQ